MSIYRVTAAKVDVQPALIRGHENQGLIYFTWTETPVVGAQCAACNTILWVDQRTNIILNESKPDNVPESGQGYQAYAKEKIRRFLTSMPSCPHCGQHNFDRFVNNVNYPRFPSGEDLVENIPSTDVLNVDAQNIEVALLD